MNCIGQNQPGPCFVQYSIVLFNGISASVAIFMAKTDLQKYKSYILYNENKKQSKQKQQLILYKIFNINVMPVLVNSYSSH